MILRGAVSPLETHHLPHKPYDGTLKGLLGAQAPWIVPYLLPGAKLQIDPWDGERNIEINRSTLQVDLLYKALYRHQYILVIIEVQTKDDPDLQRRLMAYHASLHLKYNLPVLILVIYLFEHGPADLSYEDTCHGEVLASIHPKVIRLRDLNSQQIVRDQQLSLYTLLPATKRPEVHLLKQALQEMHEHYTAQQFRDHVIWFRCILHRTKTMSDEEKQSIEEVLHMQYHIDPLLREDPFIMAIAAEEAAKSEARGEARGRIEGLQDAILALIRDRFPAVIVSQVEETITPTQDTEQLRNFLRQLGRVSDEQEIPDLLARCFPRQDEIKLRSEGKIQGLQEAIFDVMSDRFSAQALAQVQQTIAPIQDSEQLKKFLRQLSRVSDEHEALALLARCFPTH